MRSISDQNKTRDIWEKQIASGDVSLFPRQTEVPKSRTLNDITDFKSEVETESIADLAKTKKRWERLSISDENILQSTSPKQKIVSQPPRSVGLPSRSTGQQNRTVETSNQLYKSSLPTTNGTDEEVFLSANNYYEDTNMPITKVPPPSKQNFRPTQNIRVPPSATAPVVNSSAAQNTPQQSSRPELRQSESFIDREIREQQQREQEIRIRAANASDRELQASELERREKEQERIAAHESIIDREIRLQREREQELERERQRKLAAAQQGIQQIEKPQVKPLLSPPVKESSSARSVSPAFPSQSVSMQEASGIGYEEAISTYAHQGESIIAKELREQKEREMELRKRWKEMGMESPLDNSVPDTPYNRPDLPQPKHTSRQMKSKKDALTAYSDLPIMKKVGHQRSPSEKSSETPRAHVSPLVSDMDDDNVDAANETPIEREIRLAQERESELRRMKGIIAEKVADVVKLEFSPGMENILQKSDTERGTIKRLAASKLHNEILQEQERENEMKRQTKPRSGSGSGSMAMANGKSPQTNSVNANSVNANSVNVSTNSRYYGDVVRGEDLSKTRKMEAEARIQQELKEMREREEELRKLHGGALSSSFTQDNGHLNNNYEMTANGGVNGGVPVSKSMSSLSINGTEKAARRKSTLAEEWERRVANGNNNDFD